MQFSTWHAGKENRQLAMMDYHSRKKLLPPVGLKFFEGCETSYVDGI